MIIGVDGYAAPHLNLKGAVRDALAMARFLTAGAEPLVEPARVKLLLSRTPSSPAPDGAMAAVEATRKNIIEAFRDVAGKPAGRLFVHFSGHGLFAPGLGGGEAILPQDYEPADPGISIRLEGIRDFLRASRFSEQFYFIDACRNTPLDGMFQIGQFPLLPDPAAMRPGVQQYVFCATLRGVKASEDRITPNEERGVFTAPLVEGLAGAGSAKVFDEDAGVYRVTAGRLLRYVRDAVRARVVELGLAEGSEVPQEPRLLGEIGDTEVAIVTIPADRVAAVDLSFAVTPKEAAAQARVAVRRDEEREVGPPVDEAARIALAPRDYRVSVSAAGYVPERPSWRVELFENRRLELAMHKDSGLEAMAEAGAAWLRARSAERLSMVRLLDARGQAIASGREELRAEALEAGVYRLQWLGPDGTILERSVELAEGAVEDLRFEPPPQVPPLARGLRMRLSGQGVHLIPDGETRPLGTGVHELALASGVRLAVPVVRSRATVVMEGEGGVAVLFPAGTGRREAARLEEVETAQRYFRAGLWEAAIEFAVAASSAADPMPGLIEAYARLAMKLAGRDRSERSGEGVRRLVESWPEIPDVHLLQAETGTDPQGSCERALEAGVPLFELGMRRLVGLARSLQLEHSNREKLEAIAAKRLAGTPWTMWSA